MSERGRERGRWNGMRQSSTTRRNIRGGTSVYVNNLPTILDKYGLKGIFKRAGKVVDTYIPTRKRGEARSRYGFVRYRSINEARKSIQVFNNREIRGCQLKVSMARSGRAPGRVKEKGNQRRDQAGKREGRDSHKTEKKIWRPIKKKKQENTSMKTLQGQVNEDFLSWLSRSLICRSQIPRDVATLASAVMSSYGQCSKIYALSGSQFIVTFQSEEERDEALQNHEELDVWFTEIKVWNQYERCSSRRVWLEVIGVPPHGWLWENFKIIAELWGCLICLGKPIFRTEAFDNMKIQIETDILAFIEDDIILNIEGLGFRVHIREVSCPGSIKENNRARADYEDSNSDNEVQGFEDVEQHNQKEEESPQSENHTHEHTFMNQKQNQDMFTTPQKDYSNCPKVAEQAEEESGKEENMSNTRTKPAQICSHECSEEIQMCLNSSVPLAMEGMGRKNQKPTSFNEEETAQGPPGFEKRINADSSGAPKALISGCADTSTNSQEESMPPGFEKRSAETKTQTAGQIEPNKLDIEGQALQDNHTNVESAEIKDQNGMNSCEILAKEALRIGQILGIKVVRNEKAAIEDIVESLSKRKGVQTRSSKKVLLNQVLSQTNQQ